MLKRGYKVKEGRRKKVEKRDEEQENRRKG
jgi:hypothetical protein